MSSETFSPERSVEEDDLLARSTKKSKVGVGSKGNTSEVDAGSPPSEEVGTQAEADEAMVPKTPLDGLPLQSENVSAMQIENILAAPVAGDQNVAAGRSRDLPSDPPAAVRPRSYLDSVVGQGSEAAPFLAEATFRESEVLEGLNEGNEQVHEAQRASITRKDRRTAGVPQGQIAVTGNGKGGASISGSRFAPLESSYIREQSPVDATNAAPVRNNGQRSTSNPTRVPQQVHGGNSAGGRARRANVIANEKQIMNEPSQSRAAPVAEERESPRSSYRGLRRAAEEDEHTVHRGEQGGAVVSTTRVLHSEQGESASTSSVGPSNVTHLVTPRLFQ
nr:uncharacterized protein LOC109157220 [Ipomoea batatas]